MYENDNLVLWFMTAIREFGGEFNPIRDFGPKKNHTSGRREDRRETYPLPKSKYYVDINGSIRRK